MKGNKRIRELRAGWGQHQLKKTKGGFSEAIKRAIRQGIDKQLPVSA